IQNYMRTNRDRFSFFDFVFAKTAVVQTVTHVVVLQLTFARAIANGAVERMIEQQKFQHGSACFLHFIGTGPDYHSICDWSVACDLELRHFSNSHHTHAAGADYAQPGMIAIT